MELNTTEGDSTELVELKSHKRKDSPEVTELNRTDLDSMETVELNRTNPDAPLSVVPIPESRSRAVRCKEFVYNPTKGTVLGRGPRLWAKIGMIYGLVAIFFGVTYILYLHKYWDKPLIEIRPKSRSPSSLIWINRGGNPNSRSFWTKQLKKFVDKIENPELINHGACQNSNEFGYKLGQPCILIKFNEAVGWDPEPYGFDGNNKYNRMKLTYDLDLEVSNNGMTRDLRDHILDLTLKYKDDVVLRRVLTTVWISCDGEGPFDKENVGPIDYSPNRGIPVHYFTFLQEQPKYKYPFIFAQFKRPTPSVLISVVCRAFAKNISPGDGKVASTSFEVLVD